MIFCGFGKTSLIGDSIKLTENFVNILDCFRRCIARRYGKQIADELLVAGVRLIVFDGTEMQDDADKDIKELLLKMHPDSEDVILNNNERSE